MNDFASKKISLRFFIWYLPSEKSKNHQKILNFFFENQAKMSKKFYSNPYDHGGILFGLENTVITIQSSCLLAPEHGKFILSR